MTSPPQATPGRVRLRLPVAVIALSAATFVVLGGLAVQEIAALTRARVHQAVLDLVTLRARDIAAFFEDRSRVVTTVLADPTVMEWWQGYTQYRRPLDADPGWAQIQAFFLAIERGDPSVQAVFFSTESTAEYFRSAGRVERPGYNPKERWWWAETIAKNRLYVATPGVDAGTGDLAVTVETTVYAPDGRFLGVAGIDVLLQTVGRLIDGITYEGAGNAFLVDERGRIIYFPAVDFSSLPRGARVTTELAAVDQLFPDTRGLRRPRAAAPHPGARLRPGPLAGRRPLRDARAGAQPVPRAALDPGAGGAQRGDPRLPSSGCACWQAWPSCSRWRRSPG